MVGRSSFLGAAPPWRVALGAMDGMNMISCEMLVNAAGLIYFEAGSVDLLIFCLSLVLWPFVLRMQLEVRHG